MHHFYINGLQAREKLLKALFEDRFEVLVGYVAGKQGPHNEVEAFKLADLGQVLREILFHLLAGGHLVLLTPVFFMKLALSAVQELFEVILLLERLDLVHVLKAANSALQKVDCSHRLGLLALLVAHVDKVLPAETA